MQKRPAYSGAFLSFIRFSSYCVQIQTRPWTQDRSPNRLAEFPARTSSRLPTVCNATPSAPNRSNADSAPPLLKRSHRAACWLVSAHNSFGSLPVFLNGVVAVCPHPFVVSKLSCRGQCVCGGFSFAKNMLSSSGSPPQARPAALP